MKGMNCSKAEALIVASLDESLDAQKIEHLEMHLQSCPKCRRIREQTVNLLATLSADLPKEPAEEFWTRYDSSLNTLLLEKDVHRRWAIPWQSAGALLAAGVLLLAIALSMFKEKEQDVSRRESVCVAVIEELDQVYGPTTDEVLAAVSESPEGVTVENTPSASQEAGPVWFEEEEDPYQLYLLDHPDEPPRESRADPAFRSRVVRTFGPVG
jgi:hypothetical protein